MAASNGLPSTYRDPAARGMPISRSAFMTSSTKKGFPSALRMMSVFTSSERLSKASMDWAMTTVSSGERAVRPIRVWYVRSPRGWP